MPACKTCRCTIFWAVSAYDRPMPVDLAPSPRGNLVPVRDDRDRVARDAQGRPYLRVLNAAQVAAYQGPRWIGHFATCPQAPTHRSRPRARVGS
jgi:hypothetical protein